MRIATRRWRQVIASLEGRREGGARLEVRHQGCMLAPVLLLPKQAAREVQVSRQATQHEGKEGGLRRSGGVVGVEAVNPLQHHDIEGVVVGSHEMRR